MAGLAVRLRHQHVAPALARVERVHGRQDLRRAEQGQVAQQHQQAFGHGREAAQAHAQRVGGFLAGIDALFELRSD